MSNVKVTTLGNGLRVAVDEMPEATQPGPASVAPPSCRSPGCPL